MLARAREIKRIRLEEAQNGNSEVPQPSVSAESNGVRPRGRKDSSVSLPDVPRRGGKGASETPRGNVAGSGAGAAEARCPGCIAFQWMEVPLEIAQARLMFLHEEVKRAGAVVSKRDSEQRLLDGCAICHIVPQNGRWYFETTKQSPLTGVYRTFRICSQPCYMQMSKVVPEAVGTKRITTW